MSDKITAPKIRGMKGQRIVAVTAYDAPSARIADLAGVDIVLVGDSVGNTVIGYDSTISVSMEEMLHHTSAASRGCSRALLVADMPFGSYQSSPSQAVDNGIALMKAGAEAVKLEGDYSEAIAALVKAGVPVMGHVGFTPQSLHKFGGYRVQGRGQQAEAVLHDAQAICDAGVFSFVVEMVPAVVAAQLTKECPAPTIGIGAGKECDGEVQVFHDLLGIAEGEPYKHTRRYMEFHSAAVQALGKYAADVRNCQFPSDENAF
ncbi:MAG: 3-methyl-2-oxobutanoate hydroxymethyltransferase [Fimbriimonadales bacterium]